MEDYYRLISSRILDGYDEMVGAVPQPQMLGGKRMRKFVLPGNSESDYPGTLSVGRMDGAHPATLGGEFWKDFGNGFPSSAEHSIKKGGVVWRDKENVVHSVGQVPMKMKGGKKSTFLKSVGKTVGKSLKKAGKEALPVLKEVGMEVLKEGKKEAIKQGKEAIKQGVKSALSSNSPPEGAGRKRGRPKKVVDEEMVGGKKSSFLKSVGKTFKNVAKKSLPVLKEIGMEVAKEALQQQSGEGGVRKKAGALLKNVPSQYHSSVYPPALASYIASLPKGHDAYGRGRDEEDEDEEEEVVEKKGGARAARGAIVKEIMKKHGLSLPQASKFVKEKGLY